MLNKSCMICRNILNEYSKPAFKLHVARITSAAAKKLQHKEGNLVIGCKRPEYNHYSGQTYNTFDEVVLASKGWNHSKAKGDSFTVYPNPDAYEENPRIPLHETGLDKSLIQCLQTQGITDLTAFQWEAISVISQRQHSILAAETGCGKTLAFLLPILQTLRESESSEQMNSPRALILTANRELAHQIGAVNLPLSDALGLKQKVIVGGRTKKFMLNPEFSNIDFLIGTPGAIGKLSNVGIFRLNKVLFTVLDEADTLIDDSFIDRLPGIIKRVSQSQLSLVSATLPKKMPAILEPYEPNFVRVTSPMLHKPLATVTQKFLRLIRSAKPPQILRIAKTTKQPLLIFTNKNSTSYWLLQFLKDNNLECARLSGDMNYAVRIEEWKKFNSGKVNILVSTDVGSRGLDTIQVAHVVNYDFPHYAADYIHRVGRTGRFGSPLSCKVTNFISGPEEIALVQKIELAIRRDEPIPNVDGNITRILQNKILRKMREGNIS